MPCPTCQTLLTDDARCPGCGTDWLARAGEWRLHYSDGSDQRVESATKARACAFAIEANGGAVEIVHVETLREPELRAPSAYERQDALDRRVEADPNAGADGGRSR